MMTQTSPSLAARMSAFANSESGTVAVTKVFFGGVVVALAIMLTVMFVWGADAEPESTTSPQAEAAEAFRLANRGRDRATVLAEGPRAYFSAEDMRSRYNIFSDPGQSSDSDLRSAHRTWMRRMNDHAYSQPGRATDMVLILEHALNARLLEPHRSF